jgi:alkylation response protein AidB-like acyl-CoA dehydrogenase
MYIIGTVLRQGSEEQEQRYLPKIAAEELRLQAFGVTEPTTGSDTTKLKTRAVRRGNHYVINGQKVWTSRVRHSDLILLLACTTRSTRSNGAPANRIVKRPSPEHPTTTRMRRYHSGYGDQNCLVGANPVICDEKRRGLRDRRSGV